MASWNELLDHLEQLPDEARNDWLRSTLKSTLEKVAAGRGDRNVVMYGSAFLQKPQAPAPSIQITAEDLNGLMSVIFGMDWAKGLTLILHTPGGVTNAAETIVEYLRQKFHDIEVVVPTFAMSAGTMIALASDRILMGRQSQLGPIDPQMPIPATGRFVSARAIVDQFDEAKDEILNDQTVAPAWLPILQSFGFGLLQEARNALDYGESMVAGWLERFMFAGQADAQSRAALVAKYFNDAGVHKSHGRRIGREEARDQGIDVQDLEADQDMQDHVLTAYHLATIIFERSPTVRFMTTHLGRWWIKSWMPPSQARPAPQSS